MNLSKMFLVLMKREKKNEKAKQLTTKQRILMYLGIAITSALVGGLTGFLVLVLVITC